MHGAAKRACSIAHTWDVSCCEDGPLRRTTSSTAAMATTTKRRATEMGIWGVGGYEGRASGSREVCVQKEEEEEVEEAEAGKQSHKRCYMHGNANDARRPCPLLYRYNILYMNKHVDRISLVGDVICSLYAVPCHTVCIL